MLKLGGTYGVINQQKLHMWPFESPLGRRLPPVQMFKKTQATRFNRISDTLPLK